MSENQNPDLTMLGSSKVPVPDSPAEATLECFPNRNPGRAYEIEFSTQEFTSLCPVTGQPDYAEIYIRYIPGDRCIESKSLKLYLASFRNEASFAEDVTNRILNDLVKVCEPIEMTVRAEFTPRGGIAVHVEASHPE